eukprot:Gb_33317 [translate_table: standard]
MFNCQKNPGHKSAVNVFLWKGLRVNDDKNVVEEGEEEASTASSKGLQDVDFLEARKLKGERARHWLSLQCMLSDWMVDIRLRLKQECLTKSKCCDYYEKGSSAYVKGFGTLKLPPLKFAPHDYTLVNYALLLLLRKCRSLIRESVVNFYRLEISVTTRGVAVRHALQLWGIYGKNSEIGGSTGYQGFVACQRVACPG